MEYWIIYDLASGDPVVRGSGPLGTGALQSLPSGSAIILVPFAVVSQPELNLEVLRAAMAADVDAAAEAARMRVLTPGAGQAITYARKEAEARGWTADSSVSTPFLDAEAGARGISRASLAAEVIALADAWVSIGAAIEGIRMGAKTHLAAATTFGAIVAAGQPTFALN